MKFYIPFHSVDGSTFKVETGKDGVTEDDMRNLRRVVKSSQKRMAKGNRLDTVSIELITEDGWEQIDVAVIVEEQDEYERLHKAIATLTPEQQKLIYQVYFQNISIREYARAIGKSHTAVRKQLDKIYTALKNNFVI